MKLGRPMCMQKENMKQYLWNIIDKCIDEVKEKHYGQVSIDLRFAKMDDSLFVPEFEYCVTHENFVFEEES